MPNKMIMKKQTENKINSKRNCGNFVKTIILPLAICAILSGFGCGQSEEKAVNNNSSTPAAAEKKMDDFQERLDSVRTGGFDFIFVFRRADGAAFSSDDKKYLKENSPRDTNQWMLTADGKTAIAGSNYKFMPENLDALKKRFNIEDYSPKTNNEGGNQNLTNAK